MFLVAGKDGGAEREEDKEYKGADTDLPSIVHPWRRLPSDPDAPTALAQLGPGDSENAPGSFNTVRNYRDQILTAAVQQVHWGLTARKTARAMNICSRTLDRKLLKCGLNHPGKCVGAFIRHPQYAYMADQSSAPPSSPTSAAPR